MMAPPYKMFFTIFDIHESLCILLIYLSDSNGVDADLEAETAARKKEINKVMKQSKQCEAAKENHKKDSNRLCLIIRS